MSRFIRIGLRTSIDNTEFAITVNNKTGRMIHDASSSSTHESGIVSGFPARTRAATDASFATPGSASRIFLFGSARVAEPRPVRDRREADTIEMEPFSFAVLIVAGNHLSVTDAVTETVCPIIALALTFARFRGRVCRCARGVVTRRSHGHYGCQDGDGTYRQSGVSVARHRHSRTL